MGSVRRFALTLILILVYGCGSKAEHKNALASWLTEPNLQDGKRVYLERAVAWPKAALDDAPKAMEALSLGELRQRLEALSRLPVGRGRQGTTSPPTMYR
jgi:hypothetical protein